MQQNLNEIFRYLRALQRYRYVATILALVVMTIVGAYSFSLPKKYKADSTVFIEKSVIDSLVRGIAITPNLNDKIRVLKYALSSRDLIVKTLEELDSPIFTKSKAEQQSYISNLKKRTIINVRGRDLFIVSLVDTDPIFVQKYINALVSKYVEENVTGKREEAYGATRFLDEQLTAFKKKLDAAEDAIINFRKKQGIYFSVDEKSTLEEMRTYTEEIEKIDLAIETLNAQKKQLKGQLETLTPTIESIFSVGSGLEGGGGVDGHPQIIAMEKKLSNLRLRYTDNYPEIVRLKFEIEELRKRLAETNEPIVDTESSKMTSLNPLYLDVQQRILEVQAELTNQQSRKQNLQRSIAKREKELHEIPETRKQLKVLIDERNSYQKIYQDLLARAGKSEVSKQMEIGNKAATFRVVDPAVRPEKPVSPNMLKMLLLALAAGLGSAAGLIFLLEILDTRVRDVDVFKEQGIDILAVIPNIMDPQLKLKMRKRDLIFYSASCCYIAGFISIFAYDLFIR